MVLRTVGEVIVIATVLAALEPVTTLDATLLSADSTWLAFTARTLKYHVAGVSELIVVALEEMSLTSLTLRERSCCWCRNRHGNAARFVSGVPSVLVVGAVQ